jgi:hypothetical protein
VLNEAFADRIFDGEREEYSAGKWGRYVRAPDVYFEIMRRLGSRFVALGEIANVRRGITSGCDAFFMPRDVTATMLAAHQTDREFRENTGGAPRRDAESGRLRIIEAGDGSVHPVEAQFVAPEVHSLMKVDRPVLRAADLDRLVLLVGDRLDQLKTGSAVGMAIHPIRSNGDFCVEEVEACSSSSTIDVCRARPLV